MKAIKRNLFGCWKYDSVKWRILVPMPNLLWVWCSHHPHARKLLLIILITSSPAHSITQCMQLAINVPLFWAPAFIFYIKNRLAQILPLCLGVINLDIEQAFVDYNNASLSRIIAVYDSKRWKPKVDSFKTVMVF